MSNTHGISSDKCIRPNIVAVVVWIRLNQNKNVFVDSFVYGKEGPHYENSFGLITHTKMHDTNAYTREHELDGEHATHEHLLFKMLVLFPTRISAPPIAFKNRSNTIDDDKYSTKTSGISMWMLRCICGSLLFHTLFVYSFNYCAGPSATRILHMYTRIAHFVRVIRRFFFSTFCLKVVSMVVINVASNENLMYEHEHRERIRFTNINT